MKLEKANPGGSIKDRIALAMVEAAEADGTLQPGGVIVEPTSGNTGIGLALVAAVKGYRLILAMPESMSVERRRILAAYGAELELTPAPNGMRGAIERATELVGEIEGAWMPQQFENPANVEVHARTSAQEILADFPDRLDALVTGVGTGGHITGVGRDAPRDVPGPPHPRRRAGRVASHLGRRARSAPDPGHRSRLPAPQPRRGPARRGRSGHERGGVRRSPRGPRARRACSSASRRVPALRPSPRRCPACPTEPSC